MKPGCDLAGAGFDEAEYPAVLVVIVSIADLLHLQLPLQESLVQHPELVADALGKKPRQTSVHHLFLFGGITVPVDHLVGEALATAAYRVANAGGADPYAGRFNGI